MTEQVVAITVQEQQPVAITLQTGIAGPPGAAGDSNFVWKQEAPLAKWTILHKLKKNPSVTVQDSANSEIEGDIEYVSLEELKLTFSAPFSGTAYLN